MIRIKKAIIPIILLLAINILYIADASVTGSLAVTSSYTAPSGLTLTQSNGTIQKNQIDVFTATFTGGTSPYTYNYTIINSATNSIFANQLYTGVTLQTNSFSWKPTTWIFGNTFKANVIITDTNPTIINSTYLTINTTQQAVYVGGGTFGTLTTTIPPYSLNLNNTKNFLLSIFTMNNIISSPTKIYQYALTIFTVSNAMGILTTFYQYANTFLFSNISITNYVIYLWEILLVLSIIGFFISDYNRIWILPQVFIVSFLVYIILIVHMPLIKLIT